MKNILITGGAGFIGSNLAHYLKDKNYNITIIDDLSGGIIENIPKEVTFYKASICDEEKITKIFSDHNFDYVYHLAAYAAEGLSPFIRNYNYTNNVVGTANIVNECVKNKVKKLIFTSSIAVYGSINPPYLETDKPQPEDPYGIAKYARELDIEQAHRMFGLDYTILRPHNVYGPRQNLADKYRNVVSIFLRAAIKNKRIDIFGSGEQIRCWTYIDDLIPQLEMCLDPKISGVYNIGSNNPNTVNDLVKIVKRTFSKARVKISASKTRGVSRSKQS
jgi:UDP-glucose 4-epimerase